MNGPAELHHVAGTHYSQLPPVVLSTGVVCANEGTKASTHRPFSNEFPETTILGPARYGVNIGSRTRLRACSSKLRGVQNRTPLADQIPRKFDSPSRYGMYEDDHACQIPDRSSVSFWKRMGSGVHRRRGNSRGHYMGADINNDPPRSPRYVLLYVGSAVLMTGRPVSLTHGIGKPPLKTNTTDERGLKAGNRTFKYALSRYRMADHTRAKNVSVSKTRDTIAQCSTGGKPSAVQCDVASGACTHCSVGHAGDGHRALKFSGCRQTLYRPSPIVLQFSMLVRAQRRYLPVMWT
ncbi:hypothetical protein PM082_002119 [Marasmius tenuissimus]|nr:hypothetical protein PM082_002119 [Marasmius tenuissimus]